MSDFRRINIYESDLTTNGVADEITDVVYVPGFAASGNVSARVPTICYTIAQFENAFGSVAPVFKSEQQYPIAQDEVTGIKYDDSKDIYAGFLTDAIPSANRGESAIWFAEGTPDPSYIYAKELITEGIPVLYERINVVDQTVDGQDDISVATMYKAFLTGSLSIGYSSVYSTVQGANLIARELAVKYITSGGYPTFEFVSGENVISEGKQNYSATDSQTEFTLNEKGITEISSVYKNNELVAASEYDVSEDKQTVTFKTAVSALSTVIINYKYEYMSQGSVICTYMLNLAKVRGDAVALLDPTDTPDRPLLPTSVGGDDQAASVYCAATMESKATSLATVANGSYGTMFLPWMVMKLNNAYIGITRSILPASFAYLKCLARSIRNNPNWLAIAGVGRGLIPDCIAAHTTKILTNAIAESYQIDPGKSSDVGISINPITNIKPYGQCIWGNRTLAHMNSNRTEFATNFLNIRNLVSDVKKQAYMAAQSLMFEQNTDILWINFKALMTPMLDRMKSGYGISGYKMIKGTPKDKTKLECEIRLYPVYAVESFDVYITLSDEEIVVE